MATDARERTFVFLNTYLAFSNFSKDDGLSIAGFEIIYDKPDYPLEREFKAPSVVDVLFSIGKPTSRSIPSGDQVPRRYEENVPITIMSVDKAGVTGTIMNSKAEIELRRITELYTTGSQRLLDTIRDGDMRLGSLTVYTTETILKYTRSTST